MKIVINNCYGGYSLSPLATKEIAKLKGKECYFFSNDVMSNEYIPLSIEEIERNTIWSAYSVPNPQDYNLNQIDKDERYKTANERADKISLDNTRENRTDKDLIEVVERLGKKANGSYAKLKVIEIPDGIKWEINEYDGNEHVSELHRTWS